MQTNCLFRIQSVDKAGSNAFMPRANLPSKETGKCAFWLCFYDNDNNDNNNSIPITSGDGGLRPCNARRPGIGLIVTLSSSAY